MAGTANKMTVTMLPTRTDGGKALRASEDSRVRKTWNWAIWDSWSSESSTKGAYICADKEVRGGVRGW